MSGNRTNPPELLLRNTFIRDGETDPETGDRWRTHIGSVSPDVTIGTRPTGVNTRFFPQVLEITTTAAKIPATPLANRNSLSIFNQSTTDTIFISDSASVTATTTAGTTSGWQVGPQESLNVDITDGVELFAISTTTVLVNVLETA